MRRLVAITHVATLPGTESPTVCAIEAGGLVLHETAHWPACALLLAAFFAEGSDPRPLCTHSDQGFRLDHGKRPVLLDNCYQ
jgi:hypothetical protein